jgi:MFS transporter, ACS family, hexuronate transporter
MRQPELHKARRTLPQLRWYICGLLFFATTVNYVDRQVIGILKPTLEAELGWRESDYGWIVLAFQCAYAMTMPVAGRIIDRLGTRLGYALAVLVWSLASISHSLAANFWQFAAARFGLGIGEAANFPAAIRTVADWFPKRERALATGIFNSGTNLGAIVAPLLVPFVAARFGWRSSFLATGSLDLIWLVLWLVFFRRPSEHSLLSQQELDLIESDREPDLPLNIPYQSLLKIRGAQAFLIGKFLTDPVWWFYLFWVPGFLHSNYGLNLVQLGPPLIVIYLAADVGSVCGGWLSSTLLKRGWSPIAARKTAMLVCALAVLPVIGIIFSGGKLWLAVALIGTAAAAHQGWSANLYTLASDASPRSAVASVVGLGGAGGAVGGMLVAPLVGYWLDFSHGAYGPLFFIAGTMYVLALAIIHVLLPAAQLNR